MAEDDWYGPLRRWAIFLTGVVGGGFFTATGLIGYDTGKRWYTATIPPETRWMGQIEWDQIIIGAVAFGCAYYQYRKIRSERKR